ncbi:phage terminase large subunit, partial [Marinobacterium sp. xm-d-509]|uniref:phage terminase large subunit n=2 Tax=unclassified Marinobacterium TaxID=2644139 RepID=UPI0015686453
QSKISFDVGPAVADQSPSVKSVGITGQLTGSRADLIVADDIEVLNNAFTQSARDKLSESVKEFDAILKPLSGSRVVFLGTPQTEDSLYSKLPDRGYKVQIWPARMPNEKMREMYGDTLAEYIKQLPYDEGQPTDPKRFDDADLIEREASYGKAGFAMQFMLSTALSDLERFPLKVRDLIVMPMDLETAPLKLQWGPIEERQYKDLPNVAMRGDKMYPPMNVGDITADFTGSVLAIDPSGRGADETGYAVVKMINGYLYVPQAGGLQGGYDKDTLVELSHIAKKHKVNHVVVESNFGDGMFVELLKPVMAGIHRCQIEEVRHSTQKERRIIDTLEPVMMNHKLVIAPEVIEEDYRTAMKYEQSVRQSKMLIYQMTRITKEKGCLRHDDRLDALSIAIAYWVESMARDEEQGIEQIRQDALDKELERFMENAIDPFGRRSGHSEKTWISNMIDYPTP